MAKEPAHSGRGSEQRKEARRQVQLKGWLRSGDSILALEIGDLSFSGALILIKGGPPGGAQCELWIEDYGPIAITIVHSGTYYCGVAILEPAAHRNPLLRWLGEDTSPIEMRDKPAAA